MPYDNFGKFYSERVQSYATGDPYRTSAEQLARNIEEFVYDTTSPVHLDLDFLAWSIDQFDRAKLGSARVFDVLSYKDGHNSLDYIKAPIPVVGEGGIEYHVYYPIEKFYAGEVPNSADGTAPVVQENEVYQKVASPTDEIQGLLDTIYSKLATTTEESN